MSTALGPASSLRARLPPRRREGALVAGVCSGLGRRLSIDPLVLRIAFLALAVAGGAGGGLVPGQIDAGHTFLLVAPPGGPGKRCLFGLSGDPLIPATVRPGDRPHPARPPG